jgi:RHS repeat-associated protein
VDASGTLTASNLYDAYGLRRDSAGTETTTHGFVGSLGHVSEGETGLVYMRARYMDPETGRFVSEDPKGDGINWFVYCYNDPTERVDITGTTTYGEV